MLTKEEESRLEYLIRTLEIQKDIGFEKRPPYYFDLEQATWLTEKLKEVNDELSKVTEELQTSNEECANLSDQLYGPL